MRSSFLLAAASAALTTAGLLVAPSANAAPPDPEARTADTPSCAWVLPSEDTCYKLWRSPVMGPWGSITLPQVLCPDDRPYLIAERFNTNTAFRLAPGIEMRNYGGIDFAVPVTFRGVNTRATGITNYSFWQQNTATNFGGSQAFEMRMHCTSNYDRSYVGG